VIGRLKPGETVARAQAEVDTIDARYRSQFTGFADGSKLGIATAPLADTLVGRCDQVSRCCLQRLALFC